MDTSEQGSMTDNNQPQPPTAAERAEWARLLNAAECCTSCAFRDRPCGRCRADSAQRGVEFRVALPRLLTALDAAEKRAERAEADHDRVETFANSLEALVSDIVAEAHGSCIAPFWIEHAREQAYDAIHKLQDDKESAESALAAERAKVHDCPAMTLAKEYRAELERATAEAEGLRALVDGAHQFVTMGAMTHSNPTVQAEASLWLDRCAVAMGWTTSRAEANRG